MRRRAERRLRTQVTPRTPRDRALRERPSPGEQDGACWLQRAGLALLVLKVALVPLAFDPQGADVFALPKSAVSRAILYPQLAVLTSYLALAVHRRWLQWSPLWIPVGLFFLVAMAATVSAVHPATALFGSPRRYLGLSSIADGLVLAVSAAVFVRTARDLRLLIVSFLTAASLVLLYAATQIAGYDPIRWVDPMISSTIGNRGVFAGYSLAAGAVSLVTLLLYFRNLRWPLKGLLGLLAFMAFAALVYSGARGPTLALPVVLVAVALVASRARPSRMLFSSRSLAVVAGALLLAVALGTPFTPAGSRLLQALSGDQSTAERAVVYRSAFEVIRRYPVLGVGPDGFVAVYASVRPPEAAALAMAPAQSSTHSWILHLAVGTGLLGLASFAGAATVALLLGWRRAERSDAGAIGLVALVAYLTQGLFNVNHVASDWLFWLGLGLITGRSLQVSNELDSPRAPLHRGGRQRSNAVLSRTSHLRPTLLSLAVGLAAAATVGNVLIANREVKLSNSARDAGNLVAARAFAEAAVARDARRADHWNVLGLALSSPSPESALQAFGRAAEAAPYDAVYVMNVAREELRLVSKDARYRGLALQHARRAVALEPNFPDTHVLLAVALREAGEARAAAAEVDRALWLAPGALEYYELAAALYEEAGDRAAAIERLERGTALFGAAGSPSAEWRLRLARLHHQVGNATRVRELVPPPKIARVLRVCGAFCLHIAFDSVADLVMDKSADSALSVANYRLNGQPFPPGTSVSSAGTRLFVLELPPEAGILRPGDILEIRGIANALGQRMEPDPTFVTVP